MAKVTGIDKVRKRLDSITGPPAVKKIGEALYAAADMIAKDAQTSITNGNKTGAIYTHYFATINGRAVPVKKRPSPHQASAPGEAPADDTSVLANGIETALVGPLHIQVRSNARYSATLEFGNSKIQERPFMRPALEKNREKALDLVRQAVAHVIRKSGG